MTKLKIKHVEDDYDIEFVLPKRKLQRRVNLRNAALELYLSTESSVILSGPAETGKTFACCLALHHRLQDTTTTAFIVRKVRHGMESNVLRTYERIAGNEVTKYGGSRPQWYDYPNGSRLYVVGLDDPNKILSSEAGYIFINQAEKLTFEDYQTLTTRVTGRGVNVAHPQILADCNPGSPKHWIINTPSIKVLYSRHEDNPALFDAKGELTKQGKRTLAILDNLTGVLKERLRYGRWVSAEGIVYTEYSAAHNVIKPFDIPLSWKRYRAIDFGFTNPFVCLWIAQSPDDKLYIYRQLYMTQRTVRQHAELINKLSKDESIEYTVADHDAEGRATLEESGIYTVAANKSILRGIEQTNEVLKDRLFFFDGSLVETDYTLEEQRLPVSVIDELDLYVWSDKDKPLDKYNHGLDALRYFIMSLEQNNKSLLLWG